MKRVMSAAAFMCMVAVGVPVGNAQTTSTPNKPTGGQTTGGQTGGKTGGDEAAGGKTTGAAASQQDAKSADAMFMRQAAMSSMAEVEHGRLATKNAASAEVRQFGQRMVDDHTKANQELKGLASKKGVTLPTELDQKHRAMQEKLSKMKGEAFDRAYMQHMVSAHQEAVKLFATESKSGKDQDAQGWAGKTLPVLQQHLTMAKDISSKLGPGSGAQ